MIVNVSGCGGGAVRPFPSRGGSAVDRETAACRPPSRCIIPTLWPMLLPTSLPSSVNHTVVRRQPSHCHQPHCFLTPSTLLLSAINAHVIVANVVVTYVDICRRRRRHDRHFCRYRCCFLADCCLWTLPSALSAAPPPSFVTSFDGVVLPPWALASDDADSRQANARWSLSCHRSPPLVSVSVRGEG
jgi:hypothetical protein